MGNYAAVIQAWMNKIEDKKDKRHKEDREDLKDEIKHKRALEIEGVKTASAKEIAEMNLSASEKRHALELNQKIKDSENANARANAQLELNRFLAKVQASTAASTIESNKASVASKRLSDEKTLADIEKTKTDTDIARKKLEGPERGAIGNFFGKTLHLDKITGGPQGPTEWGNKEPRYKKRTGGRDAVAGPVRMKK
jgi:hypothetical protein